MWEKVKQGISCEAADGQSNQELDEGVVEDLLHEGHNGHAHQSTQADDQHSQEGIHPHFEIYRYIFRDCRVMYMPARDWC